METEKIYVRIRDTITAKIAELAAMARLFSRWININLCPPSASFVTLGEKLNIKHVIYI